MTFGKPPAKPPREEVPAPSSARKAVTRPSSPRAIHLDELRKALEELREKRDEIFPPKSEDEALTSRVEALAPMAEFISSAEPLLPRKAAPLLREEEEEPITEKDPTSVVRK
jgi:hypothetical protein